MARNALSPTYDIFIAHAGTDVAFAEELSGELRRSGLSVFLDKDIPVGTPWGSAIPAAQQASRATIVLVPDEEHSAGYLRDEIDAAVRLHNSGQDAHAVFPVFLGQRRTPAYGLGSFQALSVAEEGGLGRIADKIARALSGDLPVEEFAAPHPLHAFPAFGRSEAMHPDIIEAYADLIPPDRARFLLQKANAMRREIDPNASIVEFYMLPLAENSTLDFWNRAFHQASLNGPRMVAALLLVAPPEQFSGMARNVIARRAAILNQLQTSK